MQRRPVLPPAAIIIYIIAAGGRTKANVQHVVTQTRRVWVTTIYSYVLTMVMWALSTMLFRP